MIPPLLRVRDLTVTFGTARVVDGVSFDLAPGEALGLVGESGSGKSTIARAVVGLAPAVGLIEFEGVNVLAARGPALLRARRGTQMVFQDPGGSLNPRVRLGDAIAEPMIVHTIAGDRPRRVAELMERVGLPAAWAPRYPHQLSGGQRQRVAIARALACGPRLLVCDEPTSALDVSVQAQVLNLLADLRRDMGLALLFISHDLAVVQHVCDRVAVLAAGRIIEIGDREAVLGTPREDYTRRLVEAAGLTPPCGTCPPAGHSVSAGSGSAAPGTPC